MTSVTGNPPPVKSSPIFYAINSILVLIGVLALLNGAVLDGLSLLTLGSTALFLSVLYDPKTHFAVTTKNLNIIKILGAVLLVFCVLKVMDENFLSAFIYFSSGAAVLLIGFVDKPKQ